MTKNRAILLTQIGQIATQIGLIATQIAAGATQIAAGATQIAATAIQIAAGAIQISSITIQITSITNEIGMDSIVWALFTAQFCLARRAKWPGHRYLACEMGHWASYLFVEPAGDERQRDKRSKGGATLPVKN